MFTPVSAAVVSVVTPCCEDLLIQLCRRERVCLFGQRLGFLCPLYPESVCLSVYNEVAGSGRRVKRCTRVRNELFSLYGNGVRGFICTALAVCVLGNIRGVGAGWFTRSFEKQCWEHTCPWARLMSARLSMWVVDFWQWMKEKQIFVIIYRSSERIQVTVCLHDLEEVLYIHWTQLITLRNATGLLDRGTVLWS